MAKVNSNSANGNVATGKKFSYKELLAKAMGTTPDKVQTVEEITKGTDELFKKAQEKMNELYAGDAPFVPYKAPAKKNGKTSQEVMAEIEAQIIDKENADDAEEVEIIEVVPVAGKKVIAQNSAQAQKLLSKAKEKEPSKPKSFSEMTDEEKTARRKEISAKALAAKRAKKAQAEPEPKPEPKEIPAPVVRTRTNNPKPAPAPEPKASNPVDDVLNSFINKGKSKERRTTLNSLLVEHKGLTLEKIEESTGKLNDAEVEELISKFDDIKASTKGKEEKAKPATRTRTIPPKKTSITRAETYSLALKNDPSSLEEWAKMADEIFVEGEGKSNLNQAMADVKWLSKFYLHYTGEIFPTK